MPGPNPEPPPDGIPQPDDLYEFGTDTTLRQLVNEEQTLLAIGQRAQNNAPVVIKSLRIYADKTVSSGATLNAKGLANYLEDKCINKHEVEDDQLQSNR